MIYLTIILILFTIAHIFAYVKTPIGFKQIDNEPFSYFNKIEWFVGDSDGVYTIITFNKLSLHFQSVYSNNKDYSDVNNVKFSKLHLILFYIDITYEYFGICFCNISLMYKYNQK
jgi:hypothetical protein